MKLRMLTWMKSRTSSKMGHVGSKTWSLGQILEKPFVCSTGNTFSLIITELPTITAESELIQFLGKIKERSGQYVFSSPEHNMLKGSF